MLFRLRRKELTQSAYLGKLLAVGTGIPEKLFTAWTTLLSLEINQDNYRPAIVDQKKETLQRLEQKKQQSDLNHVQSMQKLDKLTAGDDYLRPATPEEYAEFRRRLRLRHLKNKRRS